jgi:hypothetical protein
MSRNISRQKMIFLENISEYFFRQKMRFKKYVRKLFPPKIIFKIYILKLFPPKIALKNIQKLFPPKMRFM